MFATSPTEKQTVTIENVPPMTIRIDGRLMNEPGEPPMMIAAATSPKPLTSPMTVARSTLVRAWSTASMFPSAISYRPVRTAPS